MSAHVHSEAFALMTYRADDGSEEEVIWNSRDGVTQFVITLRSGKRATHANWALDRYEPEYKPPAGSRIFTDLTPERARELATVKVDAWLASSMRDNLFRMYGTREEAIESQARAALELGSPDLIEVTK